MTEPTQVAPLWSWQEASDNGERVTHLYPNDCYFAHLSIYYFALQYSRGSMVLDAGSGAGYGAAYLADNGARFVWGVDVSQKAIALSRYHFPRPNLQFQALDLAALDSFPNGYFDLIFSSNVLEHVPQVEDFFRSAWRMLKPGGTLLLAVPPVIHEASRDNNLNNPYHLNIWSPRQWHHALKLYFDEVQPYIHMCRTFGWTLDFGNAPEQTLVRESDFDFTPATVDQLYSELSYTAVYTAQKPRPFTEVPAPGSPLSFVDDSFSRPPSIAQEPEETLEQRVTTALAQRDQQIYQQQQQLTAITATLDAKNQHILRLEDLLRRIEQGRIMRLLRRIGI